MQGDRRTQTRISARTCVRGAFGAILLAAALPPAIGFAYFDLKPNDKVPAEMNGVRFDEFRGFERKWKQVTVRFRMDSGEMRFVYANDLAWQAMQKLVPDYPDGAVVAKIGMVTEADPAFPSSKVPSGARRYQFMVRDSKKYKDTDGWGYAMFDGSGKLLEGESVKTTTDACVACHRVVPEREFVFSRPLRLGQSAHLDFSGKSADRIRFVERKVSELPSSVSGQLKRSGKFESLEGPLKKAAFSGTLDEVVPLLEDRMGATGSAAGLVVDDKTFSLVIPKAGSKECRGSERVKPHRVLIRLNGRAVRDADICD